MASALYHLTAVAPFPDTLDSLLVSQQHQQSQKQPRSVAPLRSMHGLTIHTPSVLFSAASSSTSSPAQQHATGCSSKQQVEWFNSLLMQPVSPHSQLSINPAFQMDRTTLDEMLSSPADPRLSAPPSSSVESSNYSFPATPVEGLGIETGVCTPTYSDLSSAFAFTSLNSYSCASSGGIPVPAPGWLDPNRHPSCSSSSSGTASPLEFPSSFSSQNTHMIRGSAPPTTPWTQSLSEGHSPFNLPGSTTSLHGTNQVQFWNGMQAPTASTSAAPSSGTEPIVWNRRRSLTTGSVPTNSVPSVIASSSINAVPLSQHEYHHSSNHNNSNFSRGSSLSGASSYATSAQHVLPTNRVLARAVSTSCLPTIQMPLSPADYTPSPTCSSYTTCSESVTLEGTYGQGGTPLRQQPEQQGEPQKARIAMHHHRTKAQRRVLNDIVVCLQSCMPMTATMYSGGLDFSSGSYQDLGAAHPPTSEIIFGETKEARKNRQKAESKMRMRRKEIVQVGILVKFAQVALNHIRALESGQQQPHHHHHHQLHPHDGIQGSSNSGGSGYQKLLEIFAQHKSNWATLIAIEKRLFHTIRSRSGLSEHVVRKLIEKLVEYGGLR